ncbi:sulfatase-modifying factor protein [Candidatus Symbiothrix dinenymphae]|nr:sulfatase-modifying factor protein [Candidatus Symbiothrix dinenymphae]
MKKNLYLVMAVALGIVGCTEETQAPVLSVDKTEISADSVAATYTISVNSNKKWEATTASSWCRLTTDNGTITANVEANTTISPRYAAIAVNAGGLSTQIILTQAGTLAFSVDKTRISATPLATNDTIAITSKEEWTARKGATWYTISPTNGSGSLSETIIVEINENATGQTRSDTLIITAGRAQQKIAITQEGSELGLDKTEISTPSGATTDSIITVTSVFDWVAAVAIEDDTTWCKIRIIPDATGKNGKIAVSLTTNGAAAIRSAVILVSSATITREVRVIQAAALAVEVNSIFAEADTAETHKILVTSGPSWSVSGGDTWCIPSKSVTGDSLIVVINKNIGPARNATITITSGASLTHTIAVTQAGSDDNAFYLDKENIFVAETAKIDSIAVMTGDTLTTWTVISSEPVWCRVTRNYANGKSSGKGTVKIVIDENSTHDARTATITVQSGTLTQTVTVTQDGKTMPLERKEVVGGTLKRDPIEGGDTIIETFQILKYEVTEGQWKDIMGDNPAFIARGNNYPVENASWVQIQDFITKLNAQQTVGQKYRLPTEAEWEYAAKGGVNAASTQSDTLRYSGDDEIENVAWYAGNSGYAKHLVGKKAANVLGIYDMSGNVAELCSDHHNGREDFYVTRGGSYNGNYMSCRVTSRGSFDAWSRNSTVGFRLVMRPSGN